MQKAVTDDQAKQLIDAYKAQTKQTLSDVDVECLQLYFFTGEPFTTPARGVNSLLARFGPAEYCIPKLQSFWRNLAYDFLFSCTDQNFVVGTSFLRYSSKVDGGFVLEWKTAQERKAFGKIENNMEGEGIWVTDGDKKRIYSSWGLVKQQLIVPFQKKANMKPISPSSVPLANLRQQLLDKIQTKSPNLGASQRSNTSVFDTQIQQKLTKISLVKCWDTTIQTKLGSIQAPWIHQLDLAQNNLTDIPIEINTIQSLQVLNLSGNSITSIPQSLTLPNLSQLYLIKNKLTTLPYSLPLQFPALETLNLSENLIEYLPPAQRPSSVNTSQRASPISVSDNEKMQLLLWYRKLGALILTQNPLIEPQPHATLNPQTIAEYLNSHISENPVSSRYRYNTGYSRSKPEAPSLSEPEDAPQSLDAYLGCDLEDEYNEEDTKKDLAVSKSRADLSRAGSVNQLDLEAYQTIRQKIESAESKDKSSANQAKSDTLLVRPNADWVIESGKSGTSNQPFAIIDISKSNFDYTKRFRNTVHANCVGYYTPPGDKKDKNANKITLDTKYIALSIRKEVNLDNKYEVMVRTREEDRILYIPKAAIKTAKNQQYASTQSILEYLKKQKSWPDMPANSIMLNLLQNATIWVIKHEASHFEFRKLELQLKLPTLNRCGVLYAKSGQLTEEEMYSNADVPQDLYKFMDWLVAGEKITLAKHKGHKAGLDCSGNDSTGVYSYHVRFNSLGDTLKPGETAKGGLEEVEMMFHISTLLPLQYQDPDRIERKRHIGNDVVVIIYIDVHEGETPPPLNMIFKSKMTHVYIVIHRLFGTDNKVRYKVNTVYKSDCNPVPAEPCFEGAEFELNDENRKKLLVKLVNCERSGYSANELSRTIKGRKHLLLKSIHDKFPCVKTKKTGSKESAANLSFYHSDDFGEDDLVVTTGKK